MTLIAGRPVASPSEYGTPRVLHVAANAENTARYRHTGPTSLRMPVFPQDARTLTLLAGVTPPED